MIIAQFLYPGMRPHAFPSLLIFKSASTAWKIMRHSIFFKHYHIRASDIFTWFVLTTYSFNKAAGFWTKNWSRAQETVVCRELWQDFVDADGFFIVMQFSLQFRLLVQRPRALWFPFCSLKILPDYHALVAPRRCPIISPTRLQTLIIVERFPFLAR